MTDFSHLRFSEVVQWALPAFPLLKNEYSMPGINIAIVSCIANAIKRQGDVQWDEPLADKARKWHLLTGNETYDDLRLNLIIVGDAGSGKSGLMKGIQNLTPWKSCFVQSQPQYDQLIGSTEKWMEGKKWKYQPFPGQLSSDIVLIDEVLSVYLVDSPENKKIREVLRASLSRVGTNQLYKPMVRIPEEFQIRYYPECSMYQGFPQRKVPVSFVSEGDIRRSQVVSINLPLTEKERGRRFGTKEPGGVPAPGMGGSDETYKQAKEYLVYLRTKEFKMWIPTETEDYVKAAMENLKIFTASYGPKAMWYFKIAYFDLESQLYRYSSVMSVVRDSAREIIEVNIEDVKQGWVYFSSAYADTLTWLNNFTFGDFGAIAVGKPEEMDRFRQVISWLKERGAWTAIDSAVTVDELKKWMVAKRWFTSPAGGKRFYQQCVERGLIRSGQRQKVWHVWIGPTGRDMLAEVGIESPWEEK